MPPGVIFVLSLGGIVALVGVTYGVLLLARWNSERIRYVTPPRIRSAPLRSGDRRFAPVSSGETNLETDETPKRKAELEQEKITFAETETAHALARLILAEELDLTKAVKIGFGAKSGAKYQKYSALVKEAIEKEKTPHYRPLTPDKQPV